MAGRGHEEKLAGARVVEMPAGMGGVERRHARHRQARQHLRDAGGRARERGDARQRLTRVAHRGRARRHALGVDVLDAAIADQRHPADAGLSEHGPERDRRVRTLRRRADGAHAVVGGHDDDRATPATLGVQIAEQAGEGGVGGGDGPGVLGAVGSVRVAGAIDVAQVHHHEVGLGPGRELERSGDRFTIGAVAARRLPALGRQPLRQPEHVGGVLPPGHGGEQAGELRLPYHAQRHERGRRRLGHREERLHLDQRRGLEQLRRRAGRAAPVGVPRDAVRVGVDARQQRHVVRVRARRHDRVRARKHGAVRGLVRDRVEEPRHVRRVRDARGETVHDHEVDVRARRRARRRGQRGGEQAREGEEGAHLGRVDPSRAKS